MDATAILDYFAPLRQWLDQQAQPAAAPQPTAAAPPRPPAAPPAAPPAPPGTND
jgi:hypothetical protein